MYPKIILRVFRTLVEIFIAFLKMCASVDESSNEPKIYKFLPFKYEEIVPSNGSRIPLARSGHRIGADSCNFYSFGGYNPLITHDETNREHDDFLENSFPLFQELWKFNFASKTWVRYPNSETLPVELASNALLLHGNLLMVYGGTGSPFGYRCSNQLYICNISEEDAKMAEIKAWGKFPLPLYGQALVYHNECLYTIGGTTGLSYTCDIHRLDLHNYEWREVFLSKGQINNDEPEGRYRHEVAFDGENIFILGGGTAQLVYDFEDLPTFNLEKKCWKTTKTLKDISYGAPAPRRCHGAAQIDIDGIHQVFITGGHDGERIFDDLWRLNLKTYQWTYFPKCTLPREVYFHATASTPEGRLYVFGGIYSDEENFIRTNSIYSTWLCIPKLSEMCWEAVLLYFPHIVCCDHNELLNVGLPRNFVKRLPNKNSSIVY
ncbi:kelch domain-containing protein 10 [Coccinella septempunctata]|uniref:kelch domain-containing protein 10 n=1 Tax=Coccinella septempunctata TaxID=41139 RepID=UPI001D089EC7|nr:kelch domain-containing protein 10 [Coccinella septempunctata]